MFIALPLLSVGDGVEGRGAREDSIDTFIMMRHSLGLQLLLLVHLGAMQAYNICGMVIAGEAGGGGEQQGKWEGTGGVMANRRIGDGGQYCIVCAADASEWLLGRASMGK